MPLVAMLRHADDVGRADLLRLVVSARTIAELAAALEAGATYDVCGSAGFAEATSTGLTELGVPAAMIRVERFGPTA